MKSIQTKFIFLIITMIFLTVLASSVISSYFFSRSLGNDSNRILQLTCQESAQKLNALFGRIEQSVDVMAVHALDHIGSLHQLMNNQKYLQEYTEDIANLGITAANKTEGAIGVYIRYNPELLPSDSGYFMLRTLGEKDFHRVEVTDFSQYDEDDIENVGWYYTPIRNGEPTWMLPYYDKHLDVYMISYIVPLYKDGETIGIIGMDIDYAYITSLVDEIALYETGHAFLTNDKYEVLHSKQFEVGAQAFPTDMKVAYETLDNNMYLGVAIPLREIMHERDAMVQYIVLASFIVVMLSVCVNYFVAKTIIRPLKNLERAAREIAEGNLDVDIVCNSEDEVGVLAETLRKTTKELKSRIDYINDLAYLDGLTGVQNRTAYSQELIRRKEEQSEKCTVFVIDLNGLKYINDTFGHPCGNEFLITLSKMITSVFGYENTYRIGGDEFVVVSSVEKESDAKQLEKQFEDKIKAQTGNICVQAAIGYAIGEMQEPYEEIFKRADDKMYIRKQEMKKRGENSRILG